MSRLPHIASSRPARPRVWLACCLALGCALLAQRGVALSRGADKSAGPPAGEHGSDAYAVKAAGIYKVAPYFKWPEAAFKAKDDPLRIAVFGADPFGSTLETMLKGKKLGSHPISTLRFPRLEDLGECQVLFVPEKESASLPALLEKLKGRPVLVVCESASLTEQGAGVGLYIEKSKLAIAINLEALKAAQIEASSELLKLVKVYGAKKEEPAK